MDQQTILASIAISLSIAGAIITAINHKRIRSVCCKRSFTASLDIETTTPPVKLPAPILTSVPVN